VDQLAGHESALATVLSGQKKGHGSHLSTHALAGCYTTLTALVVSQLKFGVFPMRHQNPSHRFGLYWLMIPRQK